MKRRWQGVLHSVVDFVGAVCEPLKTVLVYVLPL